MDDDTAAAARRIGEVLGSKWTLDRLLGTGGMAAVYAAHDPSGQRAAVKLLHPEMTLRRDVRERFLREAYVANRIDHPGAVSVLEHGGGEDGAPAFIVMELLEGQTLADHVKNGIGTAELLDAMDQILDVLDHAHRQGIIHRDLKPDNLFVCSDGRVKILDFGLARMLDEVPGDFKTRTGMALGTLPYMAPEQALGRRDEIDGRADLFALGATAFRIASGRKLHEANSEAELLMAMASKPAPPLATVAPNVPSDVCTVIDLALAFSKDARYPDAATMQSDVRDVRAGRRPGFATTRSTKREEATRLDMPAVAPPSSRRVVGATMPLPVMDAPPPSFSPASMNAVAVPIAEAAPPHALAPASATPGRRRSIVPLLIAGAVLLMLAVAGAAVLALVAESSPATADGSAAPAPSAAPAAAKSVAATPSSSAETAPTPFEEGITTHATAAPAPAPLAVTTAAAATKPATTAASAVPAAKPAAPPKPAPAAGLVQSSKPAPAKPAAAPKPAAAAPAPPPGKPGNSSHGHEQATVTHGHAHGH